MKKIVAFFIITMLGFGFNFVFAGDLIKNEKNKKEVPKEKIETLKEKGNQKFEYKSCKSDEKNKGCKVSDLIKINKLP